MEKLVSKEKGEHYAWGDGCDGWHLVKTPGMSVIQERMPPGSSETRHFHQHSHQFFFILSGEATIEVGGAILRAKPGEGCSVEPTVGHVIRNEGISDLVFLLVSSPPSHGDRLKIEEVAKQVLFDPGRKEKADVGRKEMTIAPTGYVITNDPPSIDTLSALYLEAGWISAVDRPKMQRIIDGTSRWWIAVDEQNRQVLGMGRSLTDWGRCACVYDLIVFKNWQRQGVGTGIMKAILNDLSQAGIDIIHLWPSKGNIPFYKRLGFIPLSDEQPMMKYRKDTGQPPAGGDGKPAPQP